MSEATETIRLPLLTVQDVAESHLCCGCGACSFLDPEQVRMVDDVDEGRRPFADGPIEPTPAQQDAMAACPGIKLEHAYDDADPALIGELKEAWGPVRRIWEGYASDADLRRSASSGGAATALALYAMERRGFSGTLHIRARPDQPLLNHTVLSTDRESMLAATGSRYAPASPADGLGQIASADGPCVMIGKPCDVAASSMARQLRPELDRNLGLTIAIFCAGTPSTRGTLEMIKAMGIDDPTEVTSVRYRGNGWPGLAEAKTPDRAERMTYAESWGRVLQRHRQWRCYICPDHSGEWADISVGDPWHEPPKGEEDPGRSMVIARTAQGEAFIRGAIEAGYLTLDESPWTVLPKSQPNLEQVRGAAWGRMAVLRWMGGAVPTFKRVATRSIWLRKLSLKEKLRSTWGTISRVKRKGLRFRKPVRPIEEGWAG